MLSNKDFKMVYELIPRVCVDVVIHNKHGEFVLIKRNIEPDFGKWHLPGGSVFFGETLVQAAIRKAKEETNVDVSIYEVPFYREFIGDYQIKGYEHIIDFFTSGMYLKGKLKPDKNASDIKFFTKIPKDIIPLHKEVLIGMGFAMVNK